MLPRVLDRATMGISDEIPYSRVKRLTRGHTRLPSG
jgi:hypothetical protein